MTTTRISIYHGFENREGWGDSEGETVGPDDVGETDGEMVGIKVGASV